MVLDGAGFASVSLASTAWSAHGATSLTLVSTGVARRFRHSLWPSKSSVLLPPLPHSQLEAASLKKGGFCDGLLLKQRGSYCERLLQLSERKRGELRAQSSFRYVGKELFQVTGRQVKGASKSVLVADSSKQQHSGKSFTDLRKDDRSRFFGSDTVGTLPREGRSRLSAQKTDGVSLQGRLDYTKGQGLRESRQSSEPPRISSASDREETQAGSGEVNRGPRKQGAMIGRGRVTAPGHTLLERGTRLINTTPKESRWREARPKTLPLDHDQIRDQPSTSDSSVPKSPLIFGLSEPRQGRSKPRFTRNPQPDVASGTVEKQGVELAPRNAPSSAVVRPAPGDQAVRNGVKLQRCPSSGLLAGYETNEEVDTAEARVPPGVALEWAVKTCPVCHGTATLVCDTCDSDWPPGACPDCKGRGYKACSYCDGSGTTYGRSQRSASRTQPTKPSLPKAPTRDLADGETEEGPSLLEAYRIISNERQMRSPTSRANGAAQWLVGKPKSEEHRTKISRALQGKPRSPLSPSHKKKLSELRREFFQEPGAKERWSEEAKQLWAPRKRVMHCSYCGLQGHNSRFCPERGFVKSTNKPCLICGQPGHFWGSCPRRSSIKVPFRCKKCGEYGHDAGQCPNSSPFPGRVLCEICGLPGHRVRECPERPMELIIQRCSICGQPGHNKKRCPQRSPESG